MIGARTVASAWVALVLAGVGLVGCRPAGQAAAPPAPPLTSRMLTNQDIPADLGQVMVHSLPNADAILTATPTSSDRCLVARPITFLTVQPTDSTGVFFAGISVRGAEFAARFPGDGAARNFASLRDGTTGCETFSTYTVTAVPGLGSEAIRIESRYDLTKLVPGSAVGDRDRVVVRAGAYLIEVYATYFESTDLPNAPTDAVLELARAAVTRFG